MTNGTGTEKVMTILIYYMLLNMIPLPSLCTIYPVSLFATIPLLLYPEIVTLICIGDIKESHDPFGTCFLPLLLPLSWSLYLWIRRSNIDLTVITIVLYNNHDNMTLKLPFCLYSMYRPMQCSFYKFGEILLLMMIAKIGQYLQPFTRRKVQW